MFELIDRQTWLTVDSLPQVVREGLSADQPSVDYPAGITEQFEPLGGVIATGQQPGFGGGPLYSTFKRWTAAHLAGNNRTNNIYWVEAGDSDWNEIAKIETERDVMRWQDDMPGVPVGDRSLPDNFSEHVQKHWGQNSRFADLKPAYSGTVRSSFNRFHELCDGYSTNTLFFDGPPFLLPPDNADRQIAEWFERLPEAMAALEAGMNRIKKKYGSPQATLLPNRTGWFWVEAPLSPRLIVERLPDNRFRIGSTEYTSRELCEFVKSGTGIFIPGALWRTLLQQVLWNPVAVVVGTSEAAYWAEVAELFAWAGQKFPRVILRASATILPKNTSVLSREEILMTQPPSPEILPVWQEYALQVAALESSLEQVLTTVPVHLRDAIVKGREKALYQLHRITELGERYRDEQTGSRRKRWEHAYELIYGTGSHAPQERRLTLMEAYLRWGAEGLSELREQIFSSSGGGRFFFRETQ